MKVETLRLKDFIGIKKGLALDEITIDFSNITGLVALEGMNGCGKSTVLENLHPYNMLASREGSLYQHVCSRKAEKELCFTYQGNHYRTLLKIDGESGKSEGFIWKNGGNGSDVKGKISEYAKYIKELLGSSELFFNSVFCAQGGRKLSDMRTGELKDLFAEFLRLDRLQAHENTSKQAANIYAGKLSDIEVRLAGLQERIKGIEDLKSELVQKKGRESDFFCQKDITWNRLQAARSHVETLKETLSKNQIALQRRADIEIRITALQARIEGIDALKTDIASNINSVEIGELRKKQLDERLADNRQRIEALRETISRNIVALQRKLDIQTAIDRLTTDKETEHKAVQAEIEQLKTKYRELQGEILAADSVLLHKEAIEGAAAKEKELSEAIESRTANIETKAGELEAAKEKVHALENALKDLWNEEEKLDKDEARIGLSDFLRETRQEINDKELEIKGLDNDRLAVNLSNEIDNCKDRIKGLDCRDPRCPDDCNTCLYISSALIARERLPIAEKELQDRQKELENKKAIMNKIIERMKAKEEATVAELEKRISEISAERDQVKEKVAAKEKSLKAEKLTTSQLSESLTTARQELARLRAELAQVKVLAGRKAEIQVAETRKSDLEKQLADVTDEGMKKRTAWEQREIAITKMIDSHAQTLAQLEIEIDSAAEELIKNLNSEIESIEKVQLPEAENDIRTAREKIIKIQGDLSNMQEAEAELTQAKNEVEKITREIDAAAEGKIKEITGQIESIEKVELPNIETEIQTAREKIAQLQGELSKMADAEKELQDVTAEKEKITREISEWTYLRNCCGKNGLQALEIDGAAPLITGYANDLLSNAFGPLYTVKLLTQDAEGRECLDIVVINEDGSEILLDNLSGGQKVWCLMALRLGMTLLSKEKSGRAFETVYCDEMDGPLDPDNAMNFIAMYQAVMKVGGFKALPFISHKPSCRSLADHRLVFEPGLNPEWR